MKNAFLHAFAPPAGGNFRKIVRGRGCTLWDDKGNEYIDAMASLWYCQVGHGRAEIIDAVVAQMNWHRGLQHVCPVHKRARREGV